MTQEEQKKENPKKFSIDILGDTEKKLYKHSQKRIENMQEFRRQPHYGVNLETLWADADNAYIPHRLKTKGKRVIATDEEKGWRGALVTLGDTNWQSDLSNSGPFVKLQTALSILVDQNPTGVFTAIKKQFEATTELFKQLYTRSWQYAKSRQQLKLFVHNLSKYGWACARTYPLKIIRKTRIPSEDGKGSEEKEVVVYNDIYRENLDPRNTWMDEMTRPNDQFSTRDWCFRKVYPLETLKELFPEEKYPLMKYVTAGGNTDEVLDKKRQVNAQSKDSSLTEVYFYESLEKDTFIVEMNKIPVVVEPLPISDERGNKYLSLWQTYWNIRHALSPYGIGIYEAIRYDHAFLDKVKNMTVDQLVMSIYKMFFYTGTQQLQDTGEIRITPGVGKQVLNPKDINWLEVPGPGRDAYAGIELFNKDIDRSSGITEPLIGEVTGKTAFELAQSREAALKRLKTPMDNVLDALTAEGYITVALISLVYSIPEVIKITDPRKVNDYLNEIQSDPELYERSVDSETGNEDFYAKVFPEFPLNLSKDEQGNLIETKETRFFRVKPSGLKWEGLINIKAESILSPSKQIDKALDLEMYNMLIPLIAQPPQLYEKVAKNICKLYDKDPRDILPDLWLQSQQQPEQPLIIPQEQAQQQIGQAGPGQTPLQSPEAQQFVTRTQVPANPTGVASSIMSRLSNAFRGR